MEKKPSLKPKTAANAGAKKKDQPVYIPKPFLKGKPWDSLCMKAALGLMGGQVLLMIAFLLMGLMMLISNDLIRIVLNAALLLGCYLIYYSFGLGSGTQAVNQGEILQNRLNRGEDLHKGEQDCCYHPLKGFVIALVGVAPYVLCAIVFACITQRQMSGFGALPSWVSSLTGHSEVTDAVSYYNVTGGLTLEDILRILVRVNIMPWVNIFNSSNMDAMLILERVSPLVMLLPTVCYGLGYLQGPKTRARVHGDIAQGKRRAAKKAKKEHKRKLQAREPQQLN